MALQCPTTQDNSALLFSHLSERPGVDVSLIYERVVHGGMRLHTWAWTPIIVFESRGCHVTHSRGTRPHVIIIRVIVDVHLYQIGMAWANEGSLSRR